MSNIKRFLLHGVLAASLAAIPVAGFAVSNGHDMTRDHEKMTETPKIEKTAVSFRFGVGYGRPYYYRPYYYYYPYRPYYYRYHYAPYRYYRW